MRKISHIVANGCSFTHGAGLDSPYTQSWPCVLAKKMGIDCVNLARSGSGNDRIMRRTYEYFYEDIKNDNNPLYVIAFSGITRKDYWINKLQRYEIIDLGQKENNATLDYIENYDLYRFYREYMIHWLSLKNLFESHNIPYIFYMALDVFHEFKNEKIEIENELRNVLPNQLEIISNDEHYAGDASLVTFGYPTLPCGHWGIEANKKLADHAYDKITSLYDIQINPTKQYLTNIDFMKQLEPHYMHHYNDLHTK